MSNLQASAKIALPPQEASLTRVQDLEPWAACASAVFCAVTVTGSDSHSGLHIPIKHMFSGLGTIDLSLSTAGT